MTCKHCGGYVEWKGPLVNLTHTECAKCGGINCQEPEYENEVEAEAEAEDDPYVPELPSLDRNQT